MTYCDVDECMADCNGKGRVGVKRGRESMAVRVCEEHDEALRQWHWIKVGGTQFFLYHPEESATMVIESGSGTDRLVAKCPRCGWSKQLVPDGEQASV